MEQTDLIFPFSYVKDFYYTVRGCYRGLPMCKYQVTKQWTGIWQRYDAKGFVFDQVIYLLKYLFFHFVYHSHFR